MHIQVEWSAGACIFLAVLCMALPLDWLCASVAAAGFHELCHIISVYAFGGRIHQLKIGIRGAVLDAEPMHPLAELFSILAGPAGSIALLLIAPMMPKTAVCGLIHGLFNLLPMESLDGGRLLRCGLRMIVSDEKTEKWCRWTEKTAGYALIGITAYTSLYQSMGVMPLTAVFLLLSSLRRGKFSCKDGNLGVQ